MALRTNTLDAGQARRIALAAQGFGRKRPSGAIAKKQFDAVLNDIGLLQIDSVNVLVRSQELPLFARLGAHPRDLISNATRRGELFEFWAHEASHIPTEMHPLWRWKMVRNRDHKPWAMIAKVRAEQPDFVDSVLAHITKHGAIASGDLKTRTGKKGSWWDWDQGKAALEWLFWTGELTATRRHNDFARLYDLPERIIPAAILARPTPSESDARSELLRRSARHHGIGTLKDLCDYYRLNLTKSKDLLPNLIDEGTLIPVTVQGWKDAAYVHRDAKVPKTIDACALLSPFDPVVWFRPRAERLFDFHYRIEIYTPPAKRVFGYYVLPLLVGDQLVGRVDLKADRHAGVLRAHGVFLEPNVNAADVLERLDAELDAMASWLGLDRVEYGTNGNVTVAG